MIVLIILLCTVGAIILLDKMAVGEFGISQPIIACSLMGLIFRDFHTGLFLGVALQLVWIGALPLGSKEPPDNQTAGIVAVAGFLLLKQTSFLPVQTGGGYDEQIIFVSLIFAGLASIIGQYSTMTLKKINNRLLSAIQQNLSDRSVRCANLTGLTISFIRGFITIGFFLLLFIITAPLIKFLPQFSYRELLTLPLIISAAGLLRFVFVQKKISISILGMLTGIGLWIILR